MWALYLTKSGLVLRVRFREHPHLPSHSKEKEEEETNGRRRDWRGKWGREGVTQWRPYTRGTLRALG